MFENMSLSEILTFVLGGILIINGLISIIGGRVYIFNADRYTEDSLRAYARPMGFCNLVLGLGFVLFHLLKNTKLAIGAFQATLGPVALGIMTVIGVVLLVKARMILVRK